jgi:hypothetical protein
VSWRLLVPVPLLAALLFYVLYGTYVPEPVDLEITVTASGTCSASLPVANASAKTVRQGVEVRCRVPLPQTNSPAWAAGRPGDLYVAVQFWHLATNWTEVDIYMNLQPVWIAVTLLPQGITVYPQPHHYLPYSVWSAWAADVDVKGIADAVVIRMRVFPPRESR